MVRQPDIEPAAVDSDVVARARQRGNELWAEELIAEEDVDIELENTFDVCDDRALRITRGSVEKSPFGG